MCELYVITIITKDMTEIKQQNNPVKKYYKESERASDRERERQRERGGGERERAGGTLLKTNPQTPSPLKRAQWCGLM